MRFGRQRPRTPRPLQANEIITGDAPPVAFAPGHRGRSLPCIACGKAAGPEPVHLLLICSMQVCEHDWSHLLGGGVIRHTTCAEPDRDTMLIKLAGIESLLR